MQAFQPYATSASVARATELIPALSKTAHATVLARKLLPENVALATSAGLFRTLQPKRCGGFEESLHTHLDVVAEIARGCGSTGWCAGVYHAHAWLMGTMSDRAQSDVYAADPDARLSAVLSPRGTATRVDGGHTLSGFWPFCSGVHHASWVILGAATPDANGGPPDVGFHLVPASDIAIQDDWYMNGLTGTGSNSVVAKNVFVPAHRRVSVASLVQNEAPGVGMHASTLYYSAAVPVLALFLCGPAIGLARRALDAFKEKLPGRTIAFTFDQKQIDMPLTHVTVADAATKIDAANLILHNMIDEVEHYARAKAIMPLERRAKARMDCAYAVRLCQEAGEGLFFAAGGSGLADANPLQLAAKDLRAANVHGLLALSTNQELYGRVLLGLPPNSPTV